MVKITDKRDMISTINRQIMKMNGIKNDIFVTIWIKKNDNHKGYRLSTWYTRKNIRKYHSIIPKEYWIMNWNMDSFQDTTEEPEDYIDFTKYTCKLSSGIEKAIVTITIYNNEWKRRFGFEN